MKLHEFNTLQEASEYAIVSDTKQVGSGQARGYLVAEDIWRTLRVIQNDLEHPLFSLADAIIATASLGNSYFGVDETKADGQANHSGLALLVSNSVMTQAQADGFMARRFTKEYPYAGSTQEELDQAKERAIIGIETSETQTHYGAIGSSQDKHVRARSLEKINIQILLDEAVAYDRVFNISATHKNPEGNLYIPFGAHIHTPITIAAGQLAAEVYLSAAQIQSWSKWSATADTIGDFQLLVKAA